jgi:hypothetical protein
MRPHRPLQAVCRARLTRMYRAGAPSDEVLAEAWTWDGFQATRDGAPAIDLIDGNQLCDLLKRLKLGVRTDAAVARPGASADSRSGAARCCWPAAGSCNRCLCFEKLVHLGVGEGRVASEIKTLHGSPVACDHRFQHSAPAVAQGAPLGIAELVEHEQRVVAGAAEMAVVGAAIGRRSIIKVTPTADKRSQSSNAMLGSRPTTPQDYPERSGFAPRLERECGHRRHWADANRRPHPCASTSSAMTE